MKVAKVLIIAIASLSFAGLAMAEDVSLPAPVLEWSVYILLIFAVCVAVFASVFKKGKNGGVQTLESLLFDENPMIHSVGPDSSVTDCVTRMNELRIGAMLIMEDGKLTGIFTERDAIMRLIGAGLNPSATPVSDVMTANPVCVSPTTSVEEAMNIISSRRIRHLPVVDNGKVLGVVSSGDLAQFLLDD